MSDVLTLEAPAGRAQTASVHGAVLDAIGAVDGARLRAAIGRHYAPVGARMGRRTPPGATGK